MFSVSLAAVALLTAVVTHPRLLTRFAEAFTVQLPANQCSSDTALTTMRDCISAKAVVNPGAGEVEEDNSENAPTGCSRFKGDWLFNTAAKGMPDGASYPVCKIASG